MGLCGQDTFDTGGPHCKKSRDVILLTISKKIKMFEYCGDFSFHLTGCNANISSSTVLDLQSAQLSVNVTFSIIFDEILICKDY